jgi:hypothetical protein
LCSKEPKSPYWRILQNAQICVLRVSVYVCKYVYYTYNTYANTCLIRIHIRIWNTPAATLATAPLPSSPATPPPTSTEAYPPLALLPLLPALSPLHLYQRQEVVLLRHEGWVFLRCRHMYPPLPSPHTTPPPTSTEASPPLALLPLLPVLTPPHLYQRKEVVLLRHKWWVFLRCRHRRCPALQCP